MAFSSRSRAPDSIAPSSRSVASQAPPSASLRSPRGAGTASLTPTTGNFYQITGAATICLSDAAVLERPSTPLHPAFQGWAKNLTDAGFKLVLWTETAGRLIPLAALRERRSYADKHVDMAGEMVAFTLDPKSTLGFKTEVIASLRHYKKSHMTKANEDKLQYQKGPKEDWKDVKGDLFRFKAGSTMLSKTSEPYGTLFLTNEIQVGAAGATWEVQNDKSIAITEQAKTKQVGSIRADPSVQGFIVQAPISLVNDPESTRIQELREDFYLMACMSVMIMPIDRPAWATKTLWWVGKLGGEVVEPIMGAT